LSFPVNLVGVGALSFGIPLPFRLFNTSPTVTPGDDFLAGARSSYLNFN